MGILQQDPQSFLQGRRITLDVLDVDRQVSLRNQARHDRDWPLADELRQALLAQGIELEDGPDGTSWRVVD